MTVYYDIFLISQGNACMLFKSEFNQIKFLIKKVHSCKSTGTSCDLLIATSLQLCCIVAVTWCHCMHGVGEWYRTELWCAWVWLLNNLYWWCTFNYSTTTIIHLQTFYWKECLTDFTIITCSMRTSNYYHVYQVFEDLITCMVRSIIRV